MTTCVLNSFPLSCHPRPTDAMCFVLASSLLRSILQAAHFTLSSSHPLLPPRELLGHSRNRSNKIVTIQLDGSACPFPREDAILILLAEAVSVDRFSEVTVNHFRTGNAIGERWQLPVRRGWVEWPRHPPRSPSKPCVVTTSEQEERDVLFELARFVVLHCQSK